MPTPLKILLVEDSPSDALLVRSYLASVPEFEFAIDDAERLEQACSMLGGNSYDAILLDLSLPDSHGVASVKSLRQVTESTPIVVLSGLDDSDVIAEALSAGADNYLSKDNIDGNRIVLGILSAVHNRSSAVSITTLNVQSFLAQIEENMLRRMQTEGMTIYKALNNLMLALESYREFGYRASVLLFDQANERLHLGAAPNLPTAYNEAIDGIKIGLGVGSCGTAAFCRHSIFVVDIETDPLWKDYRELAKTHGLRACWSVPILDESKRVLGTFALYYNERRSPSNEEQVFIHAAAQVAARVIELARSDTMPLLRLST